MMKIRHLDKAKFYTAGDGSTLTELLHPLREPELQMQASIAYATVLPGRCTKRHRLRTSTEVYCIVSGTGKITVEDEMAEVKCGDTVYIPAGSWQSIENCSTEPLSFYCIVDPAWRPEDEEITDTQSFIKNENTTD